MNYKKKTKNILIDFTPSEGVSKFIKYGLFSDLKKSNKEMFSLSFRILSKTDSIRYLTRIKNLKDLQRFFLDFLFLLSYSFKIFCFYFKSHHEFLFSLLDLKYKEIQVGDCIASSYYRSERTNLYATKSFQIFIFYILSLVTVIANLRRLNRLIKDHKADYFISYETTGMEEVLRRNCIKNDLMEIRYSPPHQGYRVFKNFNGISIRKEIKSRKECYEKLTENQLLEGKELISNLVKRKIQYGYLKTSDINLDLSLQTKKNKPKSTVIIFLSTLSDAQYLYGVGPYPSLDAFQSSMIKFFLNSGLRVVIKPHPAMMKNKDYAKKDREYYESIKKQWKTKKVEEYLEVSCSNNSLYFVDEKISVIELNRVYPEFLCITQHGSVAAECAALGNMSLVGENSQYFEDDLFVTILKRSFELPKVLSLWQNFEAFSCSERNSIYRYIYYQNILSKPIYGNHLFEGLFPNDLDSSYIENWLQNFLKSDSKSFEKLTSTIEKNISNFNNDYIKPLAND